MILLSISIVTVRFNIINSVHNFVNLQSQNQYWYYLSFYLLVCFIIIFKKIGCSNMVKLFLTNIFILFLLLFLYIYLFNIQPFLNILNIDLPYLNIKYSYIHLINYILLYCFIFLNLFFFKNMFVIVCIFLINFFIIALLIDFYFFFIFFLFFFYFFFFKNFFFKKTPLLHLSLIFLLYLCFYQDYLFFITNYKINFFEINTSTISIYFLKTLNYLNIEKSSFLLINNDVYVNTFSNFNIFNDDYKNIFEKKIYNNSCSLFEFYNYNFQKIHQSTGLYIYVVIFTLLIFIKKFFYKRFFFF